MFELKEISREAAYRILKAITYKLPKNKKGDKKNHYKIVEKNENK